MERAKGLEPSTFSLATRRSTTELCPQIYNQYNLIVKFGSSDYESDEILVIPEGSYQINVAQYIYEMIVLSLPIKRIHPGIKNGTLKNDILEKLKSLEPKENKLDGSIDPRWNKLKDLL